MDLAAVVFSEYRCSEVYRLQPATCATRCLPLADRQGQFLDVVHVHKPTALMGAVCTHREPSMWPEECQSVPGDDVVHVLPKKMDPSAEVCPMHGACAPCPSCQLVQIFPPACCFTNISGMQTHVTIRPTACARQVIVLVASVPRNPGKVVDLRDLGKLEMVVSFADDEEHRNLKHSVARDLLPIIPGARVGSMHGTTHKQVQGRMACRAAAVLNASMCAVAAEAAVPRSHAAHCSPF